jgi:hypothetical protein
MKRGATALPTEADERRRERGQALAVMAIAMVAVIAMVGLIVDGGNAWAQQRRTQNGADSASEAGATQLAKRIADTDPLHDSAYWDGQVAAAIAANALANGIVVPVAYYTDVCGVLLTPSGAAASGTGTAAVVGAGSLPFGAGPAPESCDPEDVVGPVAGVQAMGEHAFNTFFARIVGISNYTASTQATAVGGFLQDTCSGPTSGNCILLPFSTYYNLVACDGPGEAVDTGIYYGSVKNQSVVLPICRVASGNVGWLDYTAGGGGTAEIIDCIERAGGSDPCQSNIATPSWWEIGQPGNTNSKPLEDALNAYSGEIVLVPIFNLMCTGGPDGSLAGDPPNYGCPGSEVCTISSTGCNPDWYHLQPFAAFRLEHAYTNGNGIDYCNPPWSTPDPGFETTNCIIGEFVDYSLGGNGTVGGGPNSSGVIGVQLIK